MIDIIPWLMGSLAGLFFMSASILFILKETKMINWSWYYVLMPVWLPSLIIIILYLLGYEPR